MDIHIFMMSDTMYDIHAEILLDASQLQWVNNEIVVDFLLKYKLTFTINGKNKLPKPIKKIKGLLPIYKNIYTHFIAR